METNEDKTQENESCSDSSASGGECCASGSSGWKNWKTAVFVLVILAAGAVAAHSLMTNGSRLPCAGNSSGACPFSKACVLNKASVLDEAEPNEVTLDNKANNPSSGCPKAAVPGCCPKAAIPGCCPKAAIPGCCPKAAIPGCCPKAAVPGCCPKAVIPGCCPKAAIPGCCPKAVIPGCCPKAAVPGCCPTVGSD